MKSTNAKAGIKEMLANMAGQKTIPLIHRKRILKLCYKRMERIGLTEKMPDPNGYGFFVIRLPFSDYGDIMIDNECYAYLRAVKKTLETECGFPQIVAEYTAEKKTMSNGLYEQYCDYQAICAIDEFLSCGVDGDYDYEIEEA